MDWRTWLALAFVIGLAWMIYKIWGDLGHKTPSPGRYKLAIKQIDNQYYLTVWGEKDHKSKAEMGTIILLDPFEAQRLITIGVELVSSKQVENQPNG